MKRSLIYLAIFTIFFWTIWGTLAYLISPITDNGHLNLPIVILFFTLWLGGVSCLIAFILSAIKATRPNQKLPKLLLLDSAIQGLIIGSWATGLLVLQLLRVATILNLALWLAIFLTAEWFTHEFKKPPQPSSRDVIHNS